MFLQARLGEWRRLCTRQWRPMVIAGIGVVAAVATLALVSAVFLDTDGKPASASAEAGSGDGNGGNAGNGNGNGGTKGKNGGAATAERSPAGTFYDDPDSAVRKWLATNPHDQRAGMIRDRIASQPQAKWFSGYNPDTIQADVGTYVGGADRVGEIPLLVVYQIPHRDCDGTSGGGAPTLDAYRTWVRRLAAGLGRQTAMVLLEPDSLALVDCLTDAQAAERYTALTDAVRIIKAANPNAKVYLDAGHSDWVSVKDQAARLERAGVRGADGFFTNVANFRTTSNEIDYGRQVLAAIGDRALHQVIDTGRNGKGPDGGAWCDPSGRSIGRVPTTSTGVATVDAFVWAKAPGETDGCVAPAGTFVPGVAYELARNSAPPSPRATGLCQVTYRISGDADHRFTVNVTVVNHGPTLNNWTVVFTFPGDQSIASTWNASTSQLHASVTVRDAGWNSTVPRDDSVTFGFQATYTGKNLPPTHFTVNGGACT